MKWLSIVVGVSLFGTTLLTGPNASAHGAFPQSAFVYEDRSDAQRLWVGTSFGLLTSRDSGSTWFWLCEQAPDYEGVKPLMNVSANGSLLVGSFDGVAVSANGGCDWNYPEGPRDSFVSSLYVERQAPQNVLALVSMGQPGGTFLNQAWHSADNGGSFRQLGTDLDPSLLAFSLVSAPSNPNHLYVTGTIRDVDGGLAQGFLLVSEDRGASWDPRIIPDANSVNIPRILGVHPERPDHVFIRLDGQAVDTLVFTDNAGGNFEEVLSGQAEIFGFALDPDLSKVRVGFGDARDPTQMPNEDDLGLWTSGLDGPLSFTRGLDGPVGCLAWIGGQLHACTSQFYHGHELARSPMGGAPWEPLLTLSGVESELSCPEGSRANSQCVSLWPETCALIGKCGVGAGGVPAAGGTSATGGAAGSGGKASVPAGTERGGCACRFETSGTPGSTLLVLLILSFAVPFRRGANLGLLAVPRKGRRGEGPRRWPSAR